MLAEFYNIGFDKLNSPSYLENITKEAIKEANMHLVNIYYEVFKPQGVTLIAILSESHLAIHTWPENETAAVECFTCGNEGDPAKAIAVIMRELKPKDFHIRKLDR